MKGKDTKESGSTQSSVKVLPWKVPATGTLTQFRHAGALMERTEERGLLCLSVVQREIHLSQWDLSFLFLPEKKPQPPWIHLSDTVTKRLLNVPTKAPPPPSLKTSLPGRSAVSIMAPLPDPRQRHCCLSSCPTPVTLLPHLVHYPPPSRLISTRLPSVTGPTL